MRFSGWCAAVARSISSGSAILQDQIELISGDLLDQKSLVSALQAARPQEVYNLGAQSFIPVSWEQPMLTGEITGLGVTRLLEAIRVCDENIRFYQASTSELFGKAQETPQTEQTAFYPRSPYGVSKLYAHWITINFRESYGPVRLRGHSLQSRVAAPRARVRHPQNHAWRGPHQMRAGTTSCASAT